MYLAEKLGRTPSSVAMKLCNIASLDPAVVSSGRAGLGNASSLDKIVWNKMRDDWDNELGSAVAMLHDSEQQAENEPIWDGYCEKETTKNAYVEIRTKQNFFRKMILVNYAGRCCMTGLAVQKLLVASHIMPWRVSRENRLNPQNGLCLSALHDRAFDSGLITVKEDMSIAVSSKLAGESADIFARESLLRLEGKKITLPEKFNPDEQLLDWHGSNVFIP